MRTSKKLGATTSKSQWAFVIGICSVLLVGATVVASFTIRSPEDEVRPYIEVFEKASRMTGYPMKVRHVEVQFLNLGESVEGTCTGRFESNRNVDVKITLNTTLWDKNSSLEREMTVLHELGHCVLKRGHTSRKSTDGTRPASLMYPYMFDEDEYRLHKGLYWEELFKNGKYD